MIKSKGGFREGITIARKIKDAQRRIDGVLSFMIHKIVEEEYIFVIGTGDVVQYMLCNDDLTIGEVVFKDGENIKLGRNGGETEILYVANKDDKLDVFLEGKTDIGKLVGLVVRENSRNERIENGKEITGLSADINMVKLECGEELNMKNVGRILTRIFPTSGDIGKSLEKIQRDLLSAMMIDNLLEMQSKKKK